jgi:hypothetical protein
MKDKVLMKIESIKFGYGGYQDAMFGLSISLSGSGSGVGDFKGTWGIDTECGDRCKWTEKDREKQFADSVRFLNKILLDAKKRTLDQLKGVPVEVEFENSTLKSWRILTEVI